MTWLLTNLCLVTVIWQLCLVEATLFRAIPNEGLKTFHHHPRRFRDLVNRHKSPAMDDTLVLNTRGKFAHSGIRKQRNAALEKPKIFRVRRKSQITPIEPRFFEDFQSARPVPAPDHMEAPRETFIQQPIFRENGNVNGNRQGRNQFSALSTQNQVPGFVQQSGNSQSNGNFQNGLVSSVFSSSDGKKRESNPQTGQFSNNNQAFSSQPFNQNRNPNNQVFNQNQNNNQALFNQNGQFTNQNQNQNSQFTNQNQNSQFTNQNQNRNPKQFTSNVNPQNTRFTNQGLNQQQNNVRTTNTFNTPQQAPIRNNNQISNTQISSSNGSPQTFNQNSNSQNANQGNQQQSNIRNTNVIVTQQPPIIQGNRQQSNVINTNVIVTPQPPRIQGNQQQNIVGNTNTFVSPQPNQGNQQQTNVINTNTFVTQRSTRIQSNNQITRAPRNRGNTNQFLNSQQGSSQFVSGRTDSNSGQGRQEERQGRDGHDGYSAPPEEDYGVPDEEYGGPEPQAEYSEPIAILKMTGLDTAPLPSFNYMYKTANDINVMAEGELKNICDEDVSVMKGSYDYIGPDGVTYKVEWYADETGFHPTLDHLPQPVEPDHPEVAAAVAAQLAFAGPPPPAPDNPCPPKISPLPSYDSPLPNYDSKR